MGPASLEFCFREHPMQHEEACRVTRSYRCSPIRAEVDGGRLKANKMQ